MLIERKIRGFTLVEMAIVITILGIFIAIATPSFRQMILNFKIRALAESVLNGLQLARASAVQRNENVQFQLTNNATVYTLGWSVTVESDGTVIQSRSPGESSSVLLIGVSPANATMVTFNGMGRVATNNPASNSITTIDVDVPTSVMAASDSRDLSIRVLPGGLIKMCNPNITDTSDVTFCPPNP